MEQPKTNTADQMNRLHQQFKPEPVEAKVIGTKPLSDKRLRFINEYMIDLNATQAAIRAGYSEKTAGEQGYEILRIPQVQTEVEKRMAELKANNELSREYVVQQLYRVMDSCDINEDKAHMLKSIDIMNKMMGMYVQTNVNINTEVPPIFPDID